MLHRQIRYYAFVLTFSECIFVCLTANFQLDASSRFESQIGSQLQVRDSNPELAASCQFAIRRYFSHRLQN